MSPFSFIYDDSDGRISSAWPSKLTLPPLQSIHNSYIFIPILRGRIAVIAEACPPADTGKYKPQSTLVSSVGLVYLNAVLKGKLSNTPEHTY